MAYGLYVIMCALINSSSWAPVVNGLLRGVGGGIHMQFKLGVMTTYKINSLDRPN